MRKLGLDRRNNGGEAKVYYYGDGHNIMNYP